MCHCSLPPLSCHPWSLEEPPPPPPHPIQRSPLGLPVLALLGTDDCCLSGPWHFQWWWHDAKVPHTNKTVINCTEKEAEPTGLEERRILVLPFFSTDTYYERQKYLVILPTYHSNRKLCTAHFPTSLLLLGSELTHGLTDRDFRAM